MRATPCAFARAQCMTVWPPNADALCKVSSPLIGFLTKPETSGAGLQRIAQRLRTGSPDTATQSEPINSMECSDHRDRYGTHRGTPLVLLLAGHTRAVRKRALRDTRHFGRSTRTRSDESRGRKSFSLK
jgi:hypothetical protein